MSRQRLAIAWIACFAVLFNMLAMPMSGAMAQTAKAPAEQLLWGSFCSSSGTRTKPYERASVFTPSIHSDSWLMLGSNGAGVTLPSCQRALEAPAPALEFFLQRAENIEMHSRQRTS